MRQYYVILMLARIWLRRLSQLMAPMVSYCSYLIISKLKVHDCLVKFLYLWCFFTVGQNKMVINHIQKLFVTNDAATIIRELEVGLPGFS